MKTLRDVKVGQSAVVTKLNGEGATKRRYGYHKGRRSICAQGRTTW